MILILGSPEDAHAEHVHSEILLRGGDAAILDGADFPESVSISLIPGEFAESTLRLADGRKVFWNEIESVYWRNYYPVGLPDLPDEEQAEIASNDSRSLFETFLQCLPARWVNSWEAFQMHQTKPAQLLAISELELPDLLRVPKTFLGNDPELLVDFVERTGSCILKPVQGGAHTIALSADHLTKENLSRLAKSPVTIQEQIEGTDVRVFIAGDVVHACSIQSKALDFRDDPEPEIVPHELPDDIAQACRVIARRLHLLWTGIDLRLQADGSYVFFEANPSPMFLGFEERCGLPLTDAVIGLLSGNEF